MSPLPNCVRPNVALALEKWHRMVATRDLSELPSIVHPQAIFRSPVANTPYGPAQALIVALSTVIQVFEDFSYHRQFASEDGLSVVLEFSTRVSGKDIKGVDLIRFDDDGLILEFEVAIRPLSGLQGLAEQMGARLGQRLQDFKQPAPKG
ncbi:MAG TPA: nuclear transport factor 2 family protein [Rubrivivax sp.]|nr:nuclear transport factor 2 family protein [Rubrivivax sp.]